MTSIANCPIHGLWRRSASILLVGPGKHGRPAVLTVKRSANASFMPNHLVFPGGLCDPADFSLSWLNNIPEYKNFAVNENAVFPDIFQNTSTDNPPEELPSHVGFRLGALREVLEETGLLVDKRSGGVLAMNDQIRTEIHQNADKFSEHMNNLGMVPDIWRLDDWSTWLTPVRLKDSARRYDTHFYILLLDSIENINATSDNKEVSTVEFWDVGDILQAANSGKVKIAPPQMYELGRLLNFSTMEELRQHIEVRRELGTERLFPILVKCRDGAMRIMSGDSLYPEVADVEGKFPPLELDMTVDECRKYFPCLHRMTLAKGQPMTLEINIELGLKQVPPVYAKKFASSML